MLIMKMMIMPTMMTMLTGMMMPLMVEGENLAIWCVEITNKTMIRMLITMVVAMMMMMQSKLLRMMMMPLRETWPTGVLE